MYLLLLSFFIGADLYDTSSLHLRFCKKKFLFLFASIVSFSLILPFHLLQRKDDGAESYDKKISNRFICH